MHHPTDRITHTTVIVVEHWLEREIAGGSCDQAKQQKHCLVQPYTGLPIHKRKNKENKKNQLHFIIHTKDMGWDVGSGLA